jgi:hypothetical protein
MFIVETRKATLKGPIVYESIGIAQWAGEPITWGSSRIYKSVIPASMDRTKRKADPCFRRVGLKAMPLWIDASVDLSLPD